MLHVSSYLQKHAFGRKTSNGQQRNTSCNTSAHVMFDDVLNKNINVCICLDNVFVLSCFVLTNYSLARLLVYNIMRKES